MGPYRITPGVARSGPWVEQNSHFPVSLFQTYPCSYLGLFEVTFEKPVEEALRTSRLIQLCCQTKVLDLIIRTGWEGISHQLVRTAPTDFKEEVLEDQVLRNPLEQLRIYNLKPAGH